jgi:Sulfotransferase family
VSAAPFFIVSSGRSGTAMMVKALAEADGVTIEHEHMVHKVQPLAVRRYQGLADEHEAKTILAKTHGVAIRNAQTGLWGDSSNKLSWLIPDLAAQFREARFVHLVRDGRKVASSYFNKLGNECYDDRSTAILADYLSGKTPDAPPPEKKYWWPQPKPGEPWAKEFPRFNQFQRIAWHWSEINRVILRDLKDVPEHRRIFVRLEDLRAQPSTVTSLMGFLGIPFRDSHFSAFARPHNVNRPVDTMLTPEQAAQFALLATPMMKRLGYARQPEYAVNY